MLKKLLEQACAASSDPDFKGPVVSSRLDVTASGPKQGL